MIWPTSTKIGIYCLLFVWIIVLAVQKEPKPKLETTSIAPTNIVEFPDTKPYTAALDVARVFGRSQGCAEAPPNLITMIADESLRVELDPRVLAAVVAVESACNQYATSSRGAIGLMQITPRVWKDSYDFEKSYNLLSPQDNIHIGSLILSILIHKYGTRPGLRRYNGCETCDEYANKILSLAARR